MSPQEFRTIRRALGLSAEGCARVLGVSAGRTIRRWEAGSREIPGPVLRLMHLLNRGWVEPGDLEAMAED